MAALMWLIAFLIYASKVNSMAIKGPPLTRYDPCGLGAIHFDKVTETLWRGVVNLGLYPNLKNDVTIDISFEEKVTINAASTNTSLIKTNDWYDFKLHLNGRVPYRYIFFVKLENNDTDDHVPIVKKFALNNYLMCNDTIKASQTVDSLNVSSDELHYRHVCGRRALSHAELVSVRTESKAGDWPWHVAIYVKDWTNNETKYECGGNIISRTAIVTAGHCLRKWGKTVDAGSVTIAAGIDNHTDVKQVGRQFLNAQEVILHPNYDDREATADLAVIKVNKLKYTEYVQPICIWGPVYDKTQLFGYQATVMGFGRTEHNRPSDVLRSAYTLVQNDTTCLDYDRQLYEPLLNEFTFCAGYGPNAGINPRNGDSGGGLVVPTMQPDHKLSWFLRGVLSKCGVPKGETLCDPRFYMVYTDVGPHYGWIYHHSGLKFKNNIMH